ncbi:MAG: membrane protein insertion efficiency factor YidD [Rugosibacter sp.]|nr:membrane protein insertion efficiency factor YidD [Rugosibacter sp.]
MISWPVKIFLFMIRSYQWTISPLIGRCCRFDPSCSNYAILALRKNGLIVGVWLTIRRVIRCHPWHPGGHDPVP